ncbi:MAG: aldehyde dehydrogenase family protein [Ignavibacteriales bacterium]|nr:aldehyde dehydrogenase family protein [Ignavibacteriales bacterium]
MSSNRGSFYLGGKWQSTGRTVLIRNPYDLSTVGEVHLAGRAEAEKAIVAARKGFSVTRNLPSHRRAEILSFIAGKIREEKEAFAGTIVKEVGKPAKAARIEVERAIATFNIAAEEAKRIGGETIPLDWNVLSEQRFGLTRRFPLGLIVAIAPFNYPLNLVAHKIAPAIASGNAWILKPPPQAPLTSLRLARIIADSGFPPEAWSVLPCENAVAESLVSDDRVAMISFTGSPKVGWYLKTKAGKKKVLLELGGNAGVIVDESADVEEAARRNVTGSFVYSGQVCIKVQRIYVHERRYDEYLERLLGATRTLKLGNPADEDTSIGPLIDDASADRVHAWITEAVSAGATLLLGGARHDRLIEPTILSGVEKTAKVFCEEVFGPVVTVHRFREFSEAIDGINDSRFGLQAGVFSNDFRNILHAFQTVEVGAVIVNDNPTYRIDHMPYGGVKDSGFGREGLKYAIEAMTEPRLMVIAP